MNPLLEAQEKLFEEKFGKFYVSIDSKTKAIRIVDIVDGIKVNGEDGSLIECVASGDIKKFLRQSNLAVIAEVVRIVEGMKRKVEDCKREKEEDWCCNSCESMMSCEIAENSRNYNQALSDLRATLLEEMK